MNLFSPFRRLTQFRNLFLLNNFNIMGIVYFYIALALMIYGVIVINNWSSGRKNIFEIYNDDI